MQTTQQSLTETPPTIRLATLEDAPALAAVLRAVGWWPMINEADPVDLNERIAALLAQDLRDDSHNLYVAFASDGALIGYVAVHWLPYLFLPGPEGFVSELFVHPGARGCGVGALLLETVEKEALRRGCSRLSLLNSRMRESYERNFYEKHGWQERQALANFIRSLI